ncbi:DinB family protein [Ornithinimicrobium cavernae]|uniref:DinB family protein n=1 Tax=Ornithinimicrobium cavernae TaxID=2666047 RepID=UPI000D695EF4|nr:DinB family protein [Ornithinimicrobium cavernae]
MTTATPNSPAPTQRVSPPRQGDEATLLRAYVAFLRDSLRLKAEGLTAEQLNTRHEPSELTIGGLLKHLAFVEHWWFSCVLRGAEFGEPWASVDWDADEDWDYHSAADDDPVELFALFDATIAESDRITEQVLATAEGLDTLAQRHPRDEDPVSLRYILLHMVEEYGRHAGHADLIRESIDGSTGE